MQKNVPGTSIEGVGCDHMVASVCYVGDREDLGCMPRGDGNGAHRALDGGHARGHGVCGRVGQTTIDVARPGERKLCRPIGCVLELKCSRSIDGKGCRTGSGIGCIARMHLQGVEVFLGILCKAGVKRKRHGTTS